MVRRWGDQSNLQTTEEIFSVCEFQKITDFISKAQRRPSDKEEKRLSININKNGRIFIVECIIFQDLPDEGRPAGLVRLRCRQAQRSRRRRYGSERS